MCFLSVLPVFDSLIARLGPVGAPAFFLFLFLDASLLMIWRLEALTHKGVEGTVLGTLCMPYLSGLGNLMFVYVLLKNMGDGTDVIINCVINNVTNMTLLIGLPALVLGLSIRPQKKARKAEKQKAKFNQLSLILTLVAMLFFTGVLWALARDGSLDLGDGLTLIAVFLFWQGFHVYEVLKENVRKPKPYSFAILIDIAFLIVSGFFLYWSVEWLVAWILQIESGFISKEHLGLLSGWLMVLPNAVLAIFYAIKRKADVVYASQIGDGHICIPLCIGLFAVFSPIAISNPTILNNGILAIAVAAVIHAFCLIVLGRLPRVVGGLLVAAYFVFLGMGFIQ